MEEDGRMGGGTWESRRSQAGRRATFEICEKRTGKSTGRGTHPTTPLMNTPLDGPAAVGVSFVSLMPSNHSQQPHDTRNFDDSLVTKPCLTVSGFTMSRAHKNNLQSEAREAKAVSESAAREAAQRKVESVMANVLKVQDRLVQALQAEVTTTNRAREAAQVRTAISAISRGSR